MRDWIKVGTYLLKYKSWYVEANWHPSRFLDYTKEVEKYDVEKSKQHDIWYREYDRARSDLSRVLKEKSALESEIVHLKDLIQAKNLIIEKLENQTKGEENEKSNSIKSSSK